MLDYKTELKKLNKRLYWHVRDDKEGTPNDIEYKIDYCMADDRNWSIDTPRQKDIKGFIKHFEDIRRTMQPDAMKVTILKKGKNIGETVLKITDTHIELVDKKEDKAELVTTVKVQEEYHDNPHEFYQRMMRDQKDSLGSMVIEKTHEIELQRLSDNHTNEMRFTKQEYEFRIRELQKELEALKEKNFDNTKTIEDRDSEIFALEEDIRLLQERLSEKNGEGEKVKTLGATLVMGKLFNMDKEEVMGLAGLMLDKEVASKPENEEKKGGLVTETDENLSEEKKKRKTDKDTIIGWLKSIDDADFQKVCAVLSTCSKEMALFDEVIKYLVEKETTKAPNTEQAAENQ